MKVIAGASSEAPLSIVDEDTRASITTVHPDIIQTHVLTRLDGPSLASAACASSELRRLCTEESLWRNICTAKWPSLQNSLVRDVVSTFPRGYRSIFTDSFPFLHHGPPVKRLDRSFAASELISAVDLYYQDKPIISRVLQTQTQTGWFLSSTLLVDLLDPKELIPTPIKYLPKDEDWLKHLEDNLNLSWILIDPTLKRSANLSSRRPVSVQRHWLTRDLEIVYAVVLAGDQRSSEFVQCKIKVTCCGKVGGKMHAKEINLMVEDMDGKQVSGKESLVIFQRAIENGKRKEVKEDEAKETFEKFLWMKRQRRERKRRREKAMDVLAIVIVITIFLFFCWFKLF